MWKIIGEETSFCENELGKLQPRSVSSSVLKENIEKVASTTKRKHPEGEIVSVERPKTKKKSSLCKEEGEKLSTHDVYLRQVQKGIDRKEEAEKKKKRKVHGVN